MTEPVQPELFVASLADALEELCTQLVFDGARGKKAVGRKLWPALDPIEAGKKVSRCLNGHSQNFSIGEIELLLRWGHEQGIHVVPRYIGGIYFYRMVPEEPTELEADAVDAVRSAADALNRATEQLGRVREFKDRMVEARGRRLAG